MASSGGSRDEPWRRMVWSLPAAVVITAAIVSIFVTLLMDGPIVIAPPRPIAIQVIELPPAAEPAAVSPAVKAERPRPEATGPFESAPAPQIYQEKALKPLRRHFRPKPRQPPPSVSHPQPVASRKTVQTPRSNANFARGEMAAHVIYTPMPEIPDSLRLRKLKLEARARFHVKTDGTATVDLIEATPDPELNRALVDALQNWRFFPALSNGEPIPSTLDLRIPILVQ